MNIYIFAFICSFLFLAAKIIINKYINKNDKPFKPILKDSIMIFILIIISDQLYKNFLDKDMKNTEISVFTDNPNF